MLMILSSNRLSYIFLLAVGLSHLLGFTCHRIGCDAFLVSAAKPQIFSKIRNSPPPSKKTQSPPPPPAETTSTSSSSSTALASSLVDPYSAAARSLFGSFLTPAALLAGALVPLGFLSPPLPDKTPWQRRVQAIYSIVAIFALSNELLAIMFATVTSNRLLQPPPPVAVGLPAVTCAYEFLLRHYEFPWVATSLHLLMGLIGFMGMIMIRIYSFFPKSVRMPATGMAGASLLAMISIANTRVAGVYDSNQSRGNANNILSWCCRYGYLLMQQIRSKHVGVVAVASLTLLAVSVVFAIRNVIVSTSASSTN